MAGDIQQPFRRSTQTDLRSTKPARVLEGFRVGEVLTAAKLSRMAEAINRNTSIGAATQTNSLRQRTVGIYEAKLIAEYEDFITVLLFPLSGNPEEVVVGKPYTLRRNPIEADGRGEATFSYSDDTPGVRTAMFTDQVSGETITQQQFIIPVYQPGDVLYVSNQIVGGCELFSGNFELQGNENAPEHFIDLNVDGRQWAAEVIAEPPVEISTEVET